MQELDVVGRAHEMTWRFNTEVIGLPIPETPTRLSPERKDWALTALKEELYEFGSSHTLSEEVDALVDLTYFALGRLVEMGVAPGPVFEEVHAANMAKRRGELSKRPNSLGYDAVKPDGWTPPDLEPYLRLTRGDVETLGFLSALMAGSELPEMPTFDLFETAEMPKPKVLVLGHARHGKDTVCEMLSRFYDLQFTSSSLFCAERVIMPAVQAAWDLWEATREKPSQHPTGFKPALGPYTSAEECFADRVNHRAFWYDAIRDFNRPDPTALAAAIYEDNDVYCGLRHAAEFHAVFNAGLPDLVVWVDRSEHVAPEGRDSCSVEPWMAHHVIDNNGSLEDLERNVRSLFDRFLGICPECQGVS